MVVLIIEEFAVPKQQDEYPRFLNDIGKGRNFTYGIHVQDQAVLQIAFEQDSTSDSFSQALREHLGDTTSTIRINLKESITEPGHPQSSPIAEHVLNYFPVSKLTPEFQRKVEDDFAQFDAIQSRESQRLSIATGWSDEIFHPELQENARAWTVLAGWNSMKLFEDCLKTESFKKAIPILYKWGAPYKMWHTQNSLVSSS